MALKKAKIIPEEKSTVNGGKATEVLFNPTEYNLAESVNYTETAVPGLDGPVLQYIAGNTQSLTLSLMLDTRGRRIFKGEQNGEGQLVEIEPQSVAGRVKEITNYLYIDGNLHRPPKATFSWGSLSFTGVITGVQQSYTMFTGEGMPLRAKLDVTFHSVLDQETRKRQQPLQSPDRTKRRVVTAGTQLWNLALEEYGDMEQWRVIARANGIMNPLDITPGQVLKIPAL